MRGSLSENPELFAFFVLASVAAAWLFATVFVSRLSGWHDLAQRFELEGDFPPERFRFQSARMKHGMNYNNCLTIGASPAGLSLETSWLLRKSHPALRIPWDEISWVRKKILWWPVVELQLGRENPVPFTVRESLAEQISKSAGRSWPVEASKQ
jgi:hypothetical protein